MEKYSADLPKRKFRHVLRNCEKSAVKHFIEKPILLNFVDLPAVFRPRL